MAFKKLVKRLRKTSAGKLAGKVAAVQAGVVTAGLVKPKVLGIKSDRNQKIFRVTGNVTKVAAAVVLGAGAAGVGPAAGLATKFGIGNVNAPGGAGTGSGLARDLKFFTEAGESGLSTEVVRNDQEGEADVRAFEVPTSGQFLNQNWPLILGGLALVGGLVWVGRGK